MFDQFPPPTGRNPQQFVQGARMGALQGWHSGLLVPVLGIAIACTGARDHHHQSDSCGSTVDSPRGTPAGTANDSVADQALEDPDERLKQRFLTVIEAPNPRFGLIQSPQYDAILMEIVRRRDTYWEALLLEGLNRIRESRELREKKWAEEHDSRYRRNNSEDLATLTALRRVQKLPDPVIIDIDSEETVEFEFTELPSFSVKARNQDVEHRAVHFIYGGNYRTGRQARWRFSVRDTNGEEVPIRKLGGWGGGGMYSEGPLEYGQTWETTLAMSSFLHPFPPGEYRVTVQYHNYRFLSKYEDPSNFVMCQSEPFTLRVKPKTLLVTGSDRRKARERIDRLPEAGSVRYIVGSYGSFAKKFIAPDSAAGLLLADGWKSIPTLVEAAADESMPAVRRAWVFGILHSMTGSYSPQEHIPAIGRCRWISSPRRVLSGIGSMGGVASPEAQQGLAELWQAWVRNVIVTNK